MRSCPLEWRQTNKHQDILYCIYTSTKDYKSHAHVSIGTPNMDAYCGVFEVVKAVVGQDEPSSLPGFHSAPWQEVRNRKEQEVTKGDRLVGTSRQEVVPACDLGRSDWSHRVSKIAIVETFVITNQ